MKPESTHCFFAARIKPGFSRLEYRWAALGLRKTGRGRAVVAGGQEVRESGGLRDCQVGLLGFQAG